MEFKYQARSLKENVLLICNTVRYIISFTKSIESIKYLLELEKFYLQYLEKAGNKFDTRFNNPR